MFDEILPHHRAAIQRVTEHFQTDPRYLSLIIGRSVAKRRALPHSDLDLMLIVSDELYTERRWRQIVRTWLIGKGVGKVLVRTRNQCPWLALQQRVEATVILLTNGKSRRQRSDVFSALGLLRQIGGFWRLLV